MAVAFFRPTFRCSRSPNPNYLSVLAGIELETITGSTNNSPPILVHTPNSSKLCTDSNVDNGSSNFQSETLEMADEPLPVTDLERFLCLGGLQSSPSPVNTLSTEISVMNDDSSKFCSTSSPDSASSLIEDRIVTAPRTTKNTFLGGGRRYFSHLLYRVNCEVGCRFLIQNLSGLEGGLAAIFRRYEGSRAHLVACCQEDYPWVPCHFLYLRARSWSQMHQIITDLDQIHPAWDLMYQLVHRK